MKLPVISLDNAQVGEIDLPEDVFGAAPRADIMARVVHWQLAKRRAGTHKVKGMGEVSGTTKKPYRQKGTGNARQGSLRAPQFRTGGVVHGPVPRDYSQRTPKKMIAAALSGLLSDRARANRLHVVEGFGIGEKPSTKTAREFLASVAPGKRVLVVVDRGDELTTLSVRNLQNVHVLFQDQLNAYDVVVSDDLVFTKAAFEAFVADRTATDTAKEDAK